jgi:hypothetical protein
MMHVVPLQLEHSDGHAPASGALTSASGVLVLASGALGSASGALGSASATLPPSMAEPITQKPSTHERPEAQSSWVSHR